MLNHYTGMHFDEICGKGYVREGKVAQVVIL